MKTLDKEAKEFAYNEKNETQKLLSYPDGLFNGFIAEFRSKFNERSKIKAQIEAVNHFCKLNGFADSNMHKSVIGMYEQQLKTLENG